MSIEREAFENHLKKMGKTDNETFSKNEDDSYQMDIIHFGWKVWQAAKSKAVPEGFALVPKEPKKEALIEIASVCIGDDFANLDESRELYQAMLAASQEPK